MNHQRDLQQMIERYIAGKASAEEIKFVESYYEFLEKQAVEFDEHQKLEIKHLADESFAAIKSSITHPPHRKTIKLYRYAAVAAIILAIGGIIWLYQPKEDLKIDQTAQKTEKLDVLPGTDKAILTLADGSKVILDNQKNENILQTEGLVISKTKDGQLIYTVKGNNANTNTVAFNTIETPRGGQFQVVLPDGSKVWLNAASSLKFPERFVGKERKVTLTGEAYFEIAKDKTHPFIVHSPSITRQNVEVLGTHFNINSYMDDQAIKTTLVEGSVKVMNLKTNASKLLSPSDQSILSDQFFTVKSVETADETAWKDGLFRFNNTNLRNILNQLERWYDIKIEEDDIPNKRYNGMVPRSAKLSEVLSMLEKTGNIDFEIAEGRKLKVKTK